MRRFVILAAAAMSLALPAAAAQVSFTDVIRTNTGHSFTPVPGAGVQSDTEELENFFVLPRFRARFGTLNSITFDFQTVFGVRTNATSITRDGGGPVNRPGGNTVTPAFFLTIGPAARPLFSVETINSVTHNCAIPRDGSCSIAESSRRVGSATRFFDSDPALSRFTGPNNFFVDLTLQSVIDTLRLVETDVTYVFRPGANIPGPDAPTLQLSVTYDFDPAPIPLPASGLAFASALGVLALYRRRRVVR